MRFGFRNWVVDADRLELRRGDAPVDVQPKVLQVLIYLLRNADRTVPKRELLDGVWPDVATGENSLTRAVSIARKLVGKDVIENVRGEGYRIAVSVERSGGAAIEARRPEFEIAGFVGRREERRLLDRFADQGREAGFVALVRGEPGIGKTRLAHEFTRASRQRGFRVVWGVAREGAPRAYGFWRDLLLDLVADATTEQLMERFGEPLQVVTEVLPDLREKHPTMRRPDALGAESARPRFFDSVSQMLCTAAAEKPLVLVVDDVQWADLGALRLLEETLAETEGHPVLWLLLARRNAEAEGRPLDEVLPGWREGTRVLELQGLDTDTVSALIAQSGSDVPSASVLSVIRERTRGNPLFVQQLVRAGLAAPRAHDPNAALEQAHLRSVTDVVRSRIDTLPESCVRALEVAAVYGSDAPVDVVADGRRCDELDLLDALEPAERAQLVVIERDGTRLAFDHELVREAVLGQLTAGARARAHHGIAESLERRLPSDEVRVLPRLAWHYSRSATRVAAKKAVDYGLRAARLEARSLAFESAADHFENAIRTAERAGIGDGRTSAALWLELAEARFHAADPMQAERAAWRSIELARTAGNATTWADAAASMSLWNLHNTGQVPTRRVETLEAALAELEPGAHRVRSRALAALAQDLHWSPERERMLELAREAIAEARLASDSSNLCQVLLTVYHALSAPADLAERDALVRENLALALELGDPEYEFDARFHDFARAIEHGEADVAEQHLGALGALAERLRRPRIRFPHANAASNLRTTQGDFVAGEAFRELGESFGHNRTEDLAFLIRAAQLFASRRLQGRLGDLAGVIGAAVDRFPSTSIEAAQAFLLYEIGQHDEARALVDALLEGGRLRIGRQMLFAANLVVFAEATAALGSDEQVQIVAEELSPYAGRMVVLQSVATLGAADRVRALLAERTGDSARAEQLFESALVLERRLGARPWEALSCRDFARWLRVQGRDAEAEIHEVRARDLAEATGTWLGPGPKSDTGKEEEGSAA